MGRSCTALFDPQWSGWIPLPPICIQYTCKGAEYIDFGLFFWPRFGRRPMAKTEKFNPVGTPLAYFKVSPILRQHWNMDWENLLSLRRYGDTEKRRRRDQDETRLGFEVDYDRIIFSSAFRSLQDKTQVLHLPISVGSRKNFVNKRLTHSLEVSVVGRSLGRAAGQQLLAKYPHLSGELSHHFNDIGAYV